MGWYGTWNLEYTGKNDKKFIKKDLKYLMGKMSWKL